jgi:hypothetical protein
MRCVLRSNAVRAMARWVSRHAPSSMRRRSPSASVAFHRRRHEPAISRGSGMTTSVPFCEKYVGEQNVSCADPVGGAAVRAARVTDRCVISATWQPTAPSRTSPGAMTPAGGGPPGSHAAQNVHIWSCGSGRSGHTANGLSCRSWPADSLPSNKRHTLPNRHSSHQHTALPPATPPGKAPGRRTGTRDARSTQPRTSSRTHPRKGHPRAMRGPDPGQQAATHTAPWPLYVRGFPQHRGL